MAGDGDLDISRGWSYPTPAEGSAYPSDLVELVSSWMSYTGQELGRPVYQPLLLRVIEAAYQASLQSEEGRRVRLQILFGLESPRPTVVFDRPLPYEPQMLVKLSPTFDIGFRWLVVSLPTDRHGRPEILGIHDPEFRFEESPPGQTADEAQSLKLTVFGPGWVRLETAGNFYCELRNCGLRTILPVNFIRRVSEWYDETALGLTADNTTEAALLRELLARAWVNILAQVCIELRGGALLVVPSFAPLEEHLKIKYRLDSPQLRDVLMARTAAGGPPAGLSKGRRPLLRRGDMHLLDRSLARISDLIASMAAVDGAVVVRRDLHLVGFGAEITHTSDTADEQVQFGRHPHGKPPSRRLTDFGMRHRSAYRFCQQVESAMAFVASQDGDLRVFCHTPRGVRLFEGVTPEEEWIVPLPAGKAALADV
jgi:hypothetical protein